MAALTPESFESGDMSDRVAGAGKVHDPSLGARGGRRKAGTKFRGVCRRPGGKFGAQIREPKGNQIWLGSFVSAEDAARAFDAAAVKLRGAAARTNFKQPVANRGVSPLPCHWQGKAALSQGGLDSPGTRHDHLSVDLPPAEWRKVDELLKDINSVDEREALIEAAGILHQISRAGHGDGRRSKPT